MLRNDILSEFGSHSFCKLIHAFEHVTAANKMFVNNTNNYTISLF